MTPPGIGTLAEGALHAQLKEWYRVDGDLVEHPVAGFVVDLVRGDLLIEIQTGGFTPLRKKLTELCESHQVRVVAPIAAETLIHRMTDDGEVLSSRRSPKRGRVEDVFGKLVAVPGLLGRFELEVVLVRQEEYRVHREGKAFRRRGWVVSGRALVEVQSSHLIKDPVGAGRLLPSGLGDTFGTADVALAAGIPRRLAQQMTYCLSRMGQIELAGKQGNAVVYRKVPL